MDLNDKGNVSARINWSRLGLRGILIQQLGDTWILPLCFALEGITFSLRFPASSSLDCLFEGASFQPSPAYITLSRRIKFFFLIKVYLIYSWQCCVGFRCTTQWFSYTCVYVYIYIYSFFFRFFSITGYYKISNIVPCVIQLVLFLLVIYVMYSSMYILIPN